MSILKELSELQNPIQEIWERSSYSSVKHQSLMNLALKKGKMIEEFDVALDDMFLHAIRKYRNLQIFLFMNMEKSSVMEHYHRNLKSMYVRFGVKTEMVNKDTLLKILYQLHFDELVIQQRGQIEDFMKEQYPFFKNGNDETMYPMTILILCIKSKTSQYRTIRNPESCVYVPSTPLNEWVLSTIFLNRNTLNLIRNQEFRFYLMREYEAIRRWITLYRNFYFRDLNPLDQSQVLLFSSVMLYFIGHRRPNDMDIMAHQLSEEGLVKMQDFRERYQREEIDFLEHPSVERDFSEMKCMDISIKNTESYPHYWNQWLHQWARAYGARYFEEILGNGEFHGYFLGMKTVTIECDMVRRRLRNRPNGIADMISFKKRYPMYDIDLPSPPEYRVEYRQKSKMTEEEIREITGKEDVIEHSDEFEIRKPIDIDHFCNQIARSLRDRYRMTDMTGNDVKSELHIAPRPRITMSIRKREEELTVGSIMKSISLSVSEEEKKPEPVEEKESEEPVVIVKKPLRKKIIGKN